jgi:hypothetical protein
MTKEEKSEDYDRLQYEFTQISQDLKSEKRKNKALKKELILSGVSKSFTENKMDDAYDKGYNDGHATGSTIM